MSERDYWAVQFTDSPGNYIWIGWDRDRVNENLLPNSLAFKMILFKTRKEAREWVKTINAKHAYWHHGGPLFVVKRVRVTVAPPPRINGKLV